MINDQEYFISRKNKEVKNLENEFLKNSKKLITVRKGVRRVRKGVRRDIRTFAYKGSERMF